MGCHHLGLVCSNKDNMIHTIEASGKRIGIYDAKTIGEALRVGIHESRHG